MPSDDEEEGEDQLHDYGEDGEESLNNLLANMDEETREKYKKGDLTDE